MASINNKKTVKIEMTDGVLIPEKSEKSIFSAWKIAFGGAIGLLALLPIVKPEPYLEIIKFLPEGILITLQVTVLSIICAVAFGLLVGLGRISRNTVINRFATVYIEIIRGIPLLVQLFYIYYALAMFVKIPDFFAAVIALSVCYSAYIGEVFRAGIQSIPRGQMEAALALGMSRSQAIRKVILPQTFKIVLPPIGNESIALLKDSSLVSILAIADLLRRGREFSSTTFMYFETYTVIALVYLVLTLFFSRIVGILEERFSHNE